VSSVLLYGAEVWGYLIKPVNSQIEKIHTSFLRQYLGVRQSTPLLALYGELGRIPLFYVILLRMIRFWIKLLTLPSNRLAKHAYQDQFRLYNENPSFSPWCTCIAETLDSIGLRDIWINQSVPSGDTFYNSVRSKIFDLFAAKWRSEIPNFTSLYNYRLFKTENVLEKYLSIIKDERHRKAFTRLRLHSHDLAIETGRHCRPKISRSLRLCVYCNLNQMEDEIHFLISCPLYQNLRVMLNQFIMGMTPIIAFNYLMQSTTPNILRKTAEFIYLAFNRRSITPRV
jgi:hypothetical protein